MPDKIQLDADKAIEILRKTVTDKNKAYIYKKVEREHLKKMAEDLGGYEASPSCAYVEGGSPSCLVGVGLHKYAGFTIDQLSAMDNGDDYESEEGVTYLEGGGMNFNQVVNLYADITNDARMVLAAAQDAQDNGLPWGDALATAEEVYALIKESDK
jgi:hypothetical protein